MQFTQGWIKKDKHLFLKDLCPTSKEIVGIKEFSRDLKLTEHITMPHLPSELVESFERQDVSVLRSGVASKATSILQLPCGSWVQSMSIKYITQPNTLICEYVSIPLEEMYFGWPGQLDFLKERLPLGNELSLSRKEMQLLHQFLKGVPRKTMARTFCVTVKAIEKRLTKIKDMLYIPQTPDASLHELLHSKGLMSFLLAHEDWFGLKGQHYIHK